MRISAFLCIAAHLGRLTFYSIPSSRPLLSRWPPIAGQHFSNTRQHAPERSHVAVALPASSPLRPPSQHPQGRLCHHRRAALVSPVTFPLATAQKAARWPRQSPNRAASTKVAQSSPNIVAPLPVGQSGAQQSAPPGLSRASAPVVSYLAPGGPLTRVTW